MKKILWIIFFGILSLCGCSTDIYQKKEYMDETLGSSSIEEMNEVSNDNVENILQINLDIIKKSQGLHLVDSFELYDGKLVDVDADVDDIIINRISKYQVILLNIGESVKEKLFELRYGKEKNNVIYESAGGKWLFYYSDSLGDWDSFRVLFPTAGPSIPGEEIFSLTYDNVDLYPFEDNILDEIEDCKVTLNVNEAIEMCNRYISDVVEFNGYKLNMIIPYGSLGRRPYYKLIYKMYQDNVPVSSFYNLHFLVDEKGIQEINGPIYSLEEIEIEKELISVTAALNLLKDQKECIRNWGEFSYKIRQISLEYIVVMEDGKPIAYPFWRFVLGETEKEKWKAFHIILGVNAVTGDVISVRRGDTF